MADFVSIIEKKKRGLALSEEDIRTFVTGAAKGTVPDYQLAALLMAIRLRGMTDRETEMLTAQMTHSGDVLSPEVDGVPVDKHSTGGVADTTSLILVPLVAACGGKVLKMSGRGLGHTGGTIDKMESIPGMRTSMSEEEFIAQVRRIGCAIVGQSASLAPADKALYALRDVTATVDSLPLIVSSILSKKFASGTKAIVLDVKTGSGAVLSKEEESLALAEAMVRVGTLAGRKTAALVTGMEEPLGSHVGNALEVKEAIDVLSGRVRRDSPLCLVALYLGAWMLLLSGVETGMDRAAARMRRALTDGSGLKKLEEMISAQSGDARVCRDTSLLPQAKIRHEILCDEDAFLSGEDCQALGWAAQHLGAGRASKEDVIDPAVGFILHRRIGDRCVRGESLCTVFASDPAKARKAEKEIRDALRFSQEACGRAKIIYDTVEADGTRKIENDRALLEGMFLKKE